MGHYLWVGPGFTHRTIERFSVYDWKFYRTRQRRFGDETRLGPQRVQVFDDDHGVEEVDAVVEKRWRPRLRLELAVQQPIQTFRRSYRPTPGTLVDLIG